MDTLIYYLPGILIAYGVMLMGMCSPGPNILSIIATSMSKGRDEGKALAMGVASGSVLWALMTLFGLTALLTLYASAMIVIKVGGAGYLLWLAFKAFRSAASAKEQPMQYANLAGGRWAYYRRGMIIQMTNPKAALSWIAIMSLGLDATAPLWIGGLIVVGAAAISFVGHWIYAVAFSTAPVVASYRRMRRWIETGLGAFFCFASYKILTSKT